MTRTMNLQNGSLMPTTICRQTSIIELGTQVAETWGSEIQGKFLTVSVPVKKARVTSSIDEIVSKWEKDPELTEHFVNARTSFSKKLRDKGESSLRTLRLSKGWSQEQLAKEISSSQSHIARIERGTENITIETCRKLSDALDIDMNTLNEAHLSQSKK